MKHGAMTPRCNSDGCTNKSVRGGVCTTHGAKIKRCSSEGCTHQAKNGGVCRRHGAEAKRCSSEGCTSLAVRGGVCFKHGAKDKIKNAAAKDAQNMLKLEECASSMGQSANYAAVKGAQITPRKEGCASSMGQRSNHSLLSRPVAACCVLTMLRHGNLKDRVSAHECIVLVDE